LIDEIGILKEITLVNNRAAPPRKKDEHNPHANRPKPKQFTISTSLLQLATASAFLGSWYWVGFFNHEEGVSARVNEGHDRVWSAGRAEPL